MVTLQDGEGSERNSSFGMEILVWPVQKQWDFLGALSQKFPHLETEFRSSHPRLKDVRDFNLS